MTIEKWTLNNILFESSAKVARCSFRSLGGVLSPSTKSASSAFRFTDPLEYDFSITGGKIDFGGIVGVDLWCALLVGEGKMGEIGEASGVGRVIES